MADHFPKLCYIQFIEHPFSEPNQATPDEFTIIINGPFSMHEYCQNLFLKIFTIGLSEISAFLDYHCNQVKYPTRWLNALEKLIKLNVELFDTRSLHHRHTKLISQIDIKRLTLQQSAPKRHHRKLNGFSDEKEYSFADVRDQLKNLETLEEKIAFLHNQIFDYRQNPPDFVCVKTKRFDRQCEIEIERFEKQELLNEKINQKKNAEKQGTRMPYNGELKVLCDVFRQLMLKSVPGGTTILPWNITQTTAFICNNFCHPDGSPINPSTVRTYLSSSKPENRPKGHHQIKI